MHKQHKKVPVSAEEQLRALAVNMPPIRALPWGQWLQVYGLAGAFFVGLVAALGASLGAVAWLVWLIFWPDPNFWYCWAGGAVAIGLYIAQSFLLAKK
jgi:hypothetical protein